MKNVIYQILNTVNGKKYIGQSENYRTRKNQHLSLLKRNKHNNSHLQRAYNKYGKKSFAFHIIEADIAINDLDEIEHFWITVFREREGVYNIIQEYCETNRQWKHNPETLQKLSEQKMGENNPNYGKSVSQETRDKLSEALKGREVSNKTRKKMSENSPKYWLGKKLSEEHLENISKSLSGENHWNYGQILPEETKEKISKALTGISLTEEHKRNIYEGSPFKKAVVQIDKTTKEILNVFDGVREAGRLTGISHQTISNVCRKHPKYKSAGGFLWEFVDVSDV